MSGRNREGEGTDRERKAICKHIVCMNNLIFFCVCSIFSPRCNINNLQSAVSSGVQGHIPVPGPFQFHIFFHFDWKKSYVYIQAGDILKEKSVTRFKRDALDHHHLNTK